MSFLKLSVNAEKRIVPCKKCPIDEAFLLYGLLGVAFICFTVSKVDIVLSQEHFGERAPNSFVKAVICDEKRWKLYVLK